MNVLFGSGRGGLEHELGGMESVVIDYNHLEGFRLVIRIVGLVAQGNS